MVVLKSKDFILRLARLSDAKTLYLHQQESEARRNFMTVPKNVAEVKREILKNKKSKKSDNFVIDIDGKAVGGIGIHDIIPNHKAIISYWIAKECRGKGIITKAVKLLTEYAFKKYKLVRISGNVRSFNKASAKVLCKAGYKLEGIMRKNKLKNGEYMDDMVFAKIK